ncbi:MAG: hypothetical protein LBT05_13720 [Planctomycetaceae bacterium]|jgi:virulence-associated protein VagC|nr:hypothetical protein [Planctomycetaceae bacterium]
MNTVKIIGYENAQAVQLPEEYYFDTDEVGFSRFGNMALLFPIKSDWSLFLEAIDEFTPDFMEHRNQPETSQEREKIC